MTAHQLGVVLILWVLFSALAASVWMCTADLIRWLDRRRAPRVDEWQQLQQKVDAIRADLDQTPLLDRIAHDEMAKFIEAWEAAE